MATGRLYKRGKAWYLDIHTGQTVDGKRERIQRRANGRTKNEAQLELDEELHKFRRQKQNGEAADNKFPLGSLKLEWIKSLDLSVKSDRTRTEYTRNITQIVDYLQDNECETVVDITEDLIEGFQREKLNDGRSNRTINLCVERLKAALEWAIGKKWISNNPLSNVSRLPKNRVKHRRDLSTEEVEALFENASPSVRPLWIFLAFTGCRKGEALSLKWSAIDFKRKFIRIASDADFETKNESSQRTIPIADKIANMLKSMKKKAKGAYVFGRLEDGERRKSDLVGVFNLHMMRALRTLRGVPTGRRLSKKEKEEHSASLAEIDDEMKKLDIHSLRYTFITELIASGVDPKTVQKLAGHKNIQTTLNIYAQCRDSNAEAAVAELPWKVHIH